MTLKTWRNRCPWCHKVLLTGKRRWRENVVIREKGTGREISLCGVLCTKNFLIANEGAKNELAKKN